jgi:hypothetical protein
MFPYGLIIVSGVGKIWSGSRLSSGFLVQTMVGRRVGWFSCDEYHRFLEELEATPARLPRTASGSPFFFLRVILRVSVRKIEPHDTTRESQP